MRRIPFAIPLLALVLAACGDEKGPTVIEPPPVIEDPVAFYGLEPCTCYEYAPAKEWEAGETTFSRKLGVAVENFGGATRLGRDYHVVRYRMSGDVNGLVRQEFLDPTDPDLLVAGINPTGERNDPIWRLDPPASLLRAQRDPSTGEAVLLPSGSLVMSEAATSQITPFSEEEGPEVRVRVQYLDEEEVEIGYWDKVELTYGRETVVATPIGFSGVEGLKNGHRRWFVPERGFVKMTLELSGETETWVLVQTRELIAEGCTPEGPEPTDLCGS